MSITFVLFIMSATSKTSTSSDQPPPTKRAKLKTDSRTDAATATYVSNPCGLDAGLWANVASGLEFGEMIHFSSTCKTFYKDVAPLIEEIKVMSPAHMHVIPARRFRGVKKVIVACLITEKKVEGQHPRLHFNDEAATRFVSFLAAFPLLNYAMIGGIDSLWDGGKEVKPYIWLNHRFDYDQARFNRKWLNSQISSMCGGYTSGLLPSTLTIDGLFPGKCVREIVSPSDQEAFSTSECRFCKIVCESMPIRQVPSLLPRRISLPNKTEYLDDNHDVCFDMSGIIEILAQRPGALELILSPSFLLSFICTDDTYRYSNYEDFDDDEQKMGFIMGLKKHDKTISFADIIKREDVEEHFRNRRQKGKPRIALRWCFFEYLQDEGFPFRQYDFDYVFDSSLNDESSNEDYM